MEMLIVKEPPSVRLSVAVWLLYIDNDKIVFITITAVDTEPVPTSLGS